LACLNYVGDTCQHGLNDCMHPSPMACPVHQCPCCSDHGCEEQVCVSTVSTTGSPWNDGTGYTCADYGALQICGPYGLDDEPTADEACCACGGGEGSMDTGEGGEGGEAGEGLMDTGEAAEGGDAMYTPVEIAMDRLAGAASTFNEAAFAEALDSAKAAVKAAGCEYDGIRKRTRKRRDGICQSFFEAIQSAETDFEWALSESLRPGKTAGTIAGITIGVCLVLGCCLFAAWDLTRTHAEDPDDDGVARSGDIFGVRQGGAMENPVYQASGDGAACLGFVVVPPDGYPSVGET